MFSSAFLLGYPSFMKVKEMQANLLYSSLHILSTCRNQKPFRHLSNCSETTGSICTLPYELEHGNLIHGSPLVFMMTVFWRWNSLSTSSFNWPNTYYSFIWRQHLHNSVMSRGSYKRRHTVVKQPQQYQKDFMMSCYPCLCPSSLRIRLFTFHSMHGPNGVGGARSWSTILRNKLKQHTSP